MEITHTPDLTITPAVADTSLFFVFSTAGFSILERTTLPRSSAIANALIAIRHNNNKLI